MEMYTYFFNLLSRLSTAGNVLAHIFLLLLLIVCITELFLSNWEITVRKVGFLKASIIIIGIDAAIQTIAGIIQYFNLSQTASKDTFFLDLILLGVSLIFCFIGLKTLPFIFLGSISIFLIGYLAYWIFTIIVSIIIIGILIWILSICFFVYIIHRIFDSD